MNHDDTSHQETPNAEAGSLAETAPPLPLTSGPLKTFTIGETRYTLLGTAHVSAESADDVRALLDSGAFDAVAIELCDARHHSMANPDAMGEQDLFQVFKQGKAGMVAASLALGAFQQRIADQSGIQPGAEMRAAVEEASRRQLPLLLVDRDVGITLKRIYSNVPWWQRFSLFSGLLGSVLSRQDISKEDIEKLKEGDMLEATFSEFAAESEALYTPLIRERDRYMALRLAEDAPPGRYQHVLVVLGAGHLKGTGEHLEAPLPAEPKVEREALKPPRRRPRFGKRYRG
ncbi:hypothetical protein HORIV_09110 [Vreelandella olivaria]|uniref:Pheromone shutdown protein n=1 Tax=Vreelandella olivaria TaxID=390919 RepID=A0ABN5WNV4_9GAMM|nr:hypothetical protein HORIV_09110 [Halomonas olivaria]